MNARILTLLCLIHASLALAGLSNCYPYALLALDVAIANPDEAAKRLADAIERFPQSPVEELLSLRASRLSANICAMSQAAKVKKSARPTTRIPAFGREDFSKEPCPPESDCTD